MNFAEFVEKLPALRKKYPDALDLTETRVSRFYSAAFFANAIRGRTPEQGYRCHVAKAWTARWHFTTKDISTVFVSQGVRHSLRIIFEQLASEGKRVAVPSDVYPVYLDIAKAVGVDFVTYEVLTPLREATLPEADWLLVPDPVKPRGGHLSLAERNHLRAWAETTPTRRILIDGVYNLSDSMGYVPTELFKLGRAVYLSSLSKRMLAPLRAGVAVFNQADAPAWEPVFRRQAVDRVMLAEAEAYLTLEDTKPHLAYAMELLIRLGTLEQLLASKGLPLWGHTEKLRGDVYLVPVALSWTALAEAGILGVPYSAFGGTREDVTVISTIGIPESLLTAEIARMGITRPTT